MKFEVGELAILNQFATNGLPNRVGEVVEITSTYASPNYDYTAELENGDLVPVREKELNKVTEEQLQFMSYIKKGNKLTYIPTGEDVIIQKVDFLHKQVEVEYKDGALQTVRFIALSPIEHKEEEVVEEQMETINGHTKEYWLDLFFGHYENEDGNYVVPKELLHNLIEKLI